MTTYLYIVSSYCQDLWGSSASRQADSWLDRTPAETMQGFTDTGNIHLEHNNIGIEREKVTVYNYIVQREKVLEYIKVRISNIHQRTQHKLTGVMLLQ